MLIPVVYKNQKLGAVFPGNLQTLITADDIIAFRRAEGWAFVGEDPIRTYDNESDYKGTEKRRQYYGLRLIEEI
jgi:hypothetical protein